LPNLSSSSILSGPNSPLKRALIADIDKKKGKFAEGKINNSQSEMNNSERKYSELLAIRKIAGEIELWKYEAIKLRLADKTYFIPDFFVMLSNLRLQFHEVKVKWKVKGKEKVHYEDDARVKIKVAAEMYPMFQFIGCYLGKDGWEYEEF